MPVALLYNVTSDPFCLVNLSGNPDYSAIEQEMKDALMQELKKSGDPRVVGPDKEVFDSYKRYSPMRSFPDPDSCAYHTIDDCVNQLISDKD